MDLQCFRCRSRLKIRRAPSCKISATSSSSQSSSSFHGSCRQIKEKGCSIIVRQPLIFHMFDPEIIVTEPAEFMSVVQRLTGSAHTRRLLRMTMRTAKEKQESLRVAADEQLMEGGMHSMQQRNKDPLKEGTTIILAPSSPNPSDQLIREEMNQEPELPLLSCIQSTNLSKGEHKTAEAIGLPEKESDELNPVSPNCSLTTSSEDNLSIEGETCNNEEGKYTMEAEEEGSSNFFDFSGDSYYGSYIDAAHDDEEVLFHYSNVLDDSYDQFSMLLLY